MNEDMFPDNTVAAVLGSAGYVGSEVVRSLSGLGMPVLEADFAGQNPVGDLREEHSFQQLLEDFLDRQPVRPTNIVLLVSTGHAVFAETLDRTRNEIEDVLLTNLGIPIFALNALATACRSRETRGSCVLMGSVFASSVPRFSNYLFSTRRSSEVYGASKAGLEQLARYYAVLLGKDKVRVNVVSPGGIYDSRTHTEEFVRAYSSDTALGRMTSREEVVDAIFFMLSDRSAGITGQTLHVDGGFRL